MEMCIRIWLLKILILIIYLPKIYGNVFSFGPDGPVALSEPIILICKINGFEGSADLNRNGALINSCSEVNFCSLGPSRNISNAVFKFEGNGLGIKVTIDPLLPDEVGMRYVCSFNSTDKEYNITISPEVTTIETLSTSTTTDQRLSSESPSSATSHSFNTDLTIRTTTFDKLSSEFERKTLLSSNLHQSSTSAFLSESTDVTTPVNRDLSKSNGLRVEVLVSTLVVSIVVIMILIILTFYCYRYHNRKVKSEKPNETGQDAVEQTQIYNARIPVMHEDSALAISLLSVVKPVEIYKDRKNLRTNNGQSNRSYYNTKYGERSYTYDEEGFQYYNGRCPKLMFNEPNTVFQGYNIYKGDGRFDTKEPTRYDY